MYLLYFKRPTEHKTKQLHRQKWNAKMANQKIDVIHDVLTCNKVGMELKPNLWYFLASSTIATFDVNSHCPPPPPFFPLLALNWLRRDEHQDFAAAPQLSWYCYADDISSRVSR